MQELPLAIKYLDRNNNNKTITIPLYSDVVLKLLWSPA